MHAPEACSSESCSEYENPLGETPCRFDSGPGQSWFLYGSRYWITRARERARGPMIERSAAITAIAAALLERGSLTGPEAHELYRDTVISALPSKIPDRERRALRSRRGAYWRGY